MNDISAEQQAARGERWSSASSQSFAGTPPTRGCTS